MDQTHHPFLTCCKANFFESRDKYSTLGGVTWPIYTLQESHDKYCTLFESHNKHSYPISLHIYWNDTLAAFVDATGFVGDAKQLHLPCFNGYLMISDNLLSFAWFSISDNLLLFTWLSIPSWIHPRKNYISIKAQRGLLYMNYIMVLGMLSRLTIQH